MKKSFLALALVAVAGFASAQTPAVQPATTPTVAPAAKVETPDAKPAVKAVQKKHSHKAKKVVVKGEAKPTVDAPISTTPAPVAVK
jgi:hypothetical protein